MPPFGGVFVVVVTCTWSMRAPLFLRRRVNLAVGGSSVCVRNTRLAAASNALERVKVAALAESIVGKGVESIVAGVKADATCVGFVVAIPKRVGMIAAPVALTTIGAFGKGAALVGTAELRAVCARGFLGEDF